MIVFHTEDGLRVVMYHMQNCCETVEIEDIAGDIQGMVGKEVLLAELVTNEDEPPREVEDTDEDTLVHLTYLWTYYKLATSNGYVTIRWYGSTYSVYSIGVNIEVCEE